MSAKKRGLEAEAMLKSLVTKKIKSDTKVEIKMESKDNGNHTKKTTSTPANKVKQDTGKEDKRDASPNEKFKVFKSALEKATDDDIDWQFMCFMKQLPPTLPEQTRLKWIRKVRMLLKITEVKKRIRKTPRCKIFTSTSLDETPVLDAMSAYIGMSWRILTPPTSSCLLCKRPLTIRNKQTQVKLHAKIGSLICSKYILRCRNCVKASRLSGVLFGAPESILYHPTRFLIFSFFLNF